MRDRRGRERSSLFVSFAGRGSGKGGLENEPSLVGGLVGGLVGWLVSGCV